MDSRFVRCCALTLSALVCLPVGASSATSKSRPPVTGAVKLDEKHLKKVDAVRCGRINGKWLPGTALPKGYFVSHAQQSVNFTKKARRSRGKAKVNLQRQAKRYAAKAKTQHAACNKSWSVPKPPVPTPTTPAPSPSAAAQPLRFDLKGSAGLAVSNTSSVKQQDVAQGGSRLMATSTSSNLLAVSATGETKRALTSGTAQVDQIVIAPSGKVYVVFSSPVNLSDTAGWSNTRCLIAEVDPESSVPACIESTLFGIHRPYRGANPAIQFDGSGGVYYAGLTIGGTALRKYHAGVTTDLINDNVSLQDYLVLPEGSVMVRGTTTTSNTSWFRRITPQGGVQTVGSGWVEFLRRFPDGNVYFGVWDTDWSVKRFLTASNTVDPKYWIATSASGRDSYFKTGDICPEGDYTTRWSFCGWAGATSEGWVQTADGKVFGAAGGALLTQLFPTIGFPQTAISDMSTSAAVGNKLVLAGLNGSGQNIATVYDSATNAEVQVLGPDAETEIYHLQPVAGTNTVMFDGLRFADNRYVLGRVDLSTNEVTVSATTPGKLKEFQTFR